MADNKAKEIIELRDSEKHRQSNFLALWYDTSALVWPQTYPINSTLSPGTYLMNNVHDVTAIEEGENATSGFINNLIPAGQMFFALQMARGELNDNYEISRYMSIITELTHEYMFNSNFISVMANVIKPWFIFGMGNCLPEWTIKTGLNYRAYPIGTYQCRENSRGIIDTMIMTLPRTALQLKEEFGDNIGKSATDAMTSPDKGRQAEQFNLIHCARPRKDYVEGRIGSINMPWESIYVQEKDEVVVDEGGFPEFPFSVPRYSVIEGEIYGRGRGVMLLPHIRSVNQEAKDVKEYLNRINNPALEVMESFDGHVDISPRALNHVVEKGTISAIDFGNRGLYPNIKDYIEGERDIIRKGFFKPAFETLEMLGKGDRRNQLEIIERLKEGMKKLSSPIGRLFAELFNPMITRTVLLLIRNGQLPPPPESIRGQAFKVEYISPLALALRDQHIKAFEYWIGLGSQMEQVFPGVTDNVDFDRAYRDMGNYIGVKTDHIRSIKDRDSFRHERRENADRQKLLEMAQLADAYAKTTKAPEPGSMAETMKENL